MKKILTYCAFFLFCLPVSYAVVDPLLPILKDEMTREFTALQKAEAPPYFIAYRVDDRQSCNIGASFGALLNSDIRRSRVLTTSLRIGSYELDNTHELRSGYGSSSVNNESGSGQNLPLDNNELAIRQRMWQSTEREYKIAQNRYEKVLANVAVKVKETDSSPDFSRIVPQKHIEEKLQFNINKDLWNKKIKNFSSLLNSNSDVLASSVHFSYELVRKYFVSTEGAEVIQNQRYATISISAITKAESGTELPLHKTYFAFLPDDLPDEKVIINDILDLSSNLSKLKVATEVEPYSGPALLSADVAGVFFHEIFGHRIEGQRLRSESDGQTFKKMVGQQVLPTFLSVWMDPTLRKFQKEDLNGFYLYDDQGVKSEKVEVVKDGVLHNFLMSRTPIDQFNKSNGHGRAERGNRATSRQSNLIVRANNGKPLPELREMLIEEAKNQEKEYGYYFASVVGGFTNTERYTTNSFNVTPTEVYRIYVDGRPDELVQGVDLVGTPLAMFRQIIAAGNDYGIFTGQCGAESGRVPVTAIAPTLLVQTIELQKKSKSQTSPPLLPKPTSCE